MATRRGLELAKRLWKWEPHSEGQRDWLLCDAKVKTAACGRRWGKSESTAIDICLWAFERPNTVQVLVAPTDDQTKIIMGEVRRRLYATPGLRFDDVRSPYAEIRFHDARRLTVPTTIMARTAGPTGKGLRGNRGHRIILEEAAYISDAIVEDVVAPIGADYDADVVKISTPSGLNHFKRDFDRGQDPLETRYASFRFPSAANPYLSAAYLENERRTKPERTWRVEWLAEFADAEGNVFRGVRQCATAQVREPQVGHRYTIGVDLAKYADFTVLTVIDLDAREVVRIDRFNEVDWRVQKRRVADLARAYNDAAVLVETNHVGDAILEDLVAEGVRATGFATTASTKPDLIDALAVAIEQQRVRYPDDPVLIAELTSYAYQRTPLGYLRMSAPQGKHDDCVISLALAWWACSNQRALATDDDFHATFWGDAPDD
jgi:hypothetical protein